MRNQQYYGYNPNMEFSPLRENYLLKVDDIPGTKPRPGYAAKNTQHYYDKLPSTNNVFEANRLMHEKLYAMGNYHQGLNPYSSQKKHYSIHQESEIARTGVLLGKDGVPQNLNTVDFPRNLTTQDIPGAMPGTLQSKTVKNHELAQRLRGSSISPAKIPATNDTLDKFQEAYRYSVPARDNRLAPHGSNNFHYTQQNQSFEQPSSSLNEQFYSAPPPQQQENRDSVNQNERSFVEERKIKHVAFKDEPREEPAQYREQPSQYKEEASPYTEQPSQYKEHISPYTGQPSHYKEQPNLYREQPSQIHQQDYLDSYISQAADYKQPNSANDQNMSMQDYQTTPLVPTAKSNYTAKKEQLDQLTRDIIAQQQSFERKIKETVRGRAFNIISNGPRNYTHMEAGRRAYGSALKAMTKNQEDLKSFDYGAPRGYTPTGQLNISSRQGDRGSVSMQNTPEPRISAQGAVGSLDTSFKHPNKPTLLPPLPPNHYYGSGPQRNHSGMKYY